MEKMLKALLFHGHVLLPQGIMLPEDCAGTRVGVMGENGVNPPVLGSSSLVSVIVSQTCPGWKAILKKCH